MELNKELFDQIKITPLLDTIKLEKIDDSEYFSSEYSTKYISNSRLGLFKSKGVKAFFEGLSANQEYNPSFNFGTWLHASVLEPEYFDFVKDVFTPTAKARLMALELYHPDGSTPTEEEIIAASNKIGYYKDKLTKSRIAELQNKCFSFWRDRFIYESRNPLQRSDKERVYIDEKSYNLLNCCLKSIDENKEFDKLMHPTGIALEPISLNEHALFLDIQIDIPGYESRIYKLKSKLDNFTIDREEETITINDLKTTSRLAKDFDPLYFSYQREIAFYSYLLKLYVKNQYNMDKPTIKGNFLVVSTIPDYQTLVYPMTPKLFKSGFEEFKYLLKCVAYFNMVKGYEIQ